MSSKAAIYRPFQLRSALDPPGVPPDGKWSDMVGSSAAIDHVGTLVKLKFPTTEEAVADMLEAVELMAAVLDEEHATENFDAFYKCFGWSSADEYFGELGDCQAMVVDVDENDLDDRPAIILMALQMASANLERRKANPEQKCTLLLDARSYEKSGPGPSSPRFLGLTVWRTLRLAARLRQVSADFNSGLSVECVFSDSADAIAISAAYLRDYASADRCADDRKMLEGAVPISRNLKEAWGIGARATIWLLSGLCAPQTNDVEHVLGIEGIHLTIFEQAQPAWNSGSPPSEDDAWNPPPARFDDNTFGQEPSNIRRSAESFRSTLDNYMRLQHAVATSRPDAVTYVTAALARQRSILPGQARKEIHGRSMVISPGKQYRITAENEALSKRAQAAFDALLAATQTERWRHARLYDELCQNGAHDNGDRRADLGSDMSTYMSDLILVAVASRPARNLGLETATRRLALIREVGGACTAEQ